MARLDVPGPRYTSYPTVPDWSEAFGGGELGCALAAAGRRAPEEPLSLYVHIPFCRELCLYCGCNVVVASDRRQADPYLDQVAAELELAAQSLGERRRLARVHWGGGTPTFLGTEQMRRLWQAIRSRFAIEAGAEIAIEADPAVTSEEQLEVLAELGFNRISFGVQDFDPAVQEAVRRHQGYEETRALVEAARARGFQSVNLDLIYGLPRQALEGFRATLERVAELAPDRVAMFSFAYVPSVRPHQKRLDVAAMPRGSRKLDLLRAAQEELLGRGYEAIGMDHFALPGDELARARRERRLWRDFQGYTVRRAAETLAAGITGISDIGGAFAQSHRSRSRYAAAVAAGRLPTERGLVLDADDRIRRDAITQVMCNGWIDLGGDGAAYFARELEDLRPLEREGLVAIRGAEVTLTPLGRVFSRNVAMVFDARLRRRAPGTRPAFSRTV